MTVIENKNLFEIEGGINISGTLINSFVRGINSLLEVGRSLGSAIRRVVDKSICPL
jgi:hypothetical protein